MKLFHFCPAHALTGIQTHGISKGVLPWNERMELDLRNRKEVLVPGFVPGWQWLTENPDWEQEWARPQPGAMFRKDEFRLTVVIPPAIGGEAQLVRWDAIDAKNAPDSRVYINSFADHRFWWLFRGSIRPAWILATDRNPILLKLPEHD